MTLILLSKKKCKSVILPFVLCGCETWFLTFCSLRVFENRVLQRMSGPKREAVTGGWSKVHNEELRNLYSLPHIKVTKSRMRW
jgi:hypothetical protein